MYLVLRSQTLIQSDVMSGTRNQHLVNPSAKVLHINV